MKKYIILSLGCLLLLGCKQEILEPEQMILGKFAFDDGSGLTSEYLDFNQGHLSVFTSTTYPLAEGKIWHTDGKTFRDTRASYSIQDGNLQTSAPSMSGPVELKDGVLTIGNKKYVAMTGFDVNPYSKIIVERKNTFPYTEQDISIPCSIERPIPAGQATVSSNSAWITNPQVGDGVITGHLSGTNTDRTGSITISYTHADAVTIQVSQAPSTFIRPASESLTLDYVASTPALDYTIENPVSTSVLTATASATWISDIQVSGTQVTFKVSENNTGANRSTTLLLKYAGARDVTVSVTQKWAASGITMTPSTQTVDYTGGSFNFNYAVTNPRANTSVAAASQANWITDVKLVGTNVSYKVSENNSGAQRTGKIKLTYGTYATAEFSVTQTWVASAITMTPSTQTVDYTGGSFNFNYAVTNPRANTSVTAASQDSWITNVSLSGTSVSYKVSENNTGAQRTGKIKLTYGSYATAEFTVTQAWTASVITMTPSTQTADYTGGSFSFSYVVTNPRANASVTAASQDTWITEVKLSGANVSYKVSENNSGAQRTGKIKLTYGSYATAEFAVTQAWTASSITMTPSAQTADYTGGSFSFNYSVTNPRANTSVTAASQVNWITDVVLSGNTVSYKVSENNSGAQRTGKIKLTYGNYATAEFTVTQRWAASSITMTPSSQSPNYAGGSFNFNFAVTNPRANTSVTATCQDTWITDVKLTGTNVSYKVSENNSGAQRTGKIKLTYGSYATAEFIVTQSWAASSITMTPPSQSPNYAGGSFSFSYEVTNPRANTSVTAASQDTWITDVVLSGTNVSYKVSVNDSGAPRTGKIKLTYGSYATAGFVVTQSGKPIVSLTLNKSEIALLAGASETLIATVDPSDALLQWSSGNTSVATVDQNGKVTAVGNGNTTITVSATDGSDKKATCAVAVTTLVSKVTLNKTSLILNEGGSETLTATISPSTASDKSLTWSSSNNAVARVDGNGKVTATGLGKAIIEARANDSSGKSASCSVSVIPVGAVDLGLSVYWASCNIGAASPEAYGDYYAWGETETKSDYSWATYKWCNGSESTLTKYNTNSSYGNVDNKKSLETGPDGDDVASKKLGGMWRMPTDAEWTEIRTKCAWTWTTRDGVYGMLVEASNGNSIFLPAAGYWEGTSLIGTGSYARYWSLSLNTDNPLSARILDFSSTEINKYGSGNRYYGRSVRPVYDCSSSLSGNGIGDIIYEEGGME